MPSSYQGPRGLVWGSIGYSIVRTQALNSPGKPNEHVSEAPFVIEVKGSFSGEFKERGIFSRAI